MEEYIQIQNIGTIKIRTGDPQVSYYQSMSPTLRLNLRVTSPQECLIITDIKTDIHLVSGDGPTVHIGMGISEEPLIKLYPNNTEDLNLRVELDHYKLQQIEKFRGGGDLKLLLSGKLLVEKEEQSQARGVGRINEFQIKVSKSDWVEKNLPYMGFKDVSLIELPKLTQEWEGITEHLNEAWRQHSMGKYDSVLIECRKTLESLSKVVKEKGFTIKEIKEGKKMPDWKRLFGSDNIGDLLKTMNQKMCGFFAPGAHTGKAINREDAYFALLVTNGIVTLVTEKLLKTPDL